ncbi:MAG: PIF1 family DEAD/DEAH box helicase, partial [bacterium]|nr:PIF1 family DEAD/DEAH box helicase [bacterium]
MDQTQALKILQSGHNVFLTGSAGTGKTFLLNKFIDYLKNKKIKTGVTASTGIAATHLGGRTIHSWSGIGIKDKLDNKALKRLARNEELWERIRNCRVLIIDEISMLDAVRLNLVDKVCRSVKNPFTPFGGLQIVLCGDFFQLPPVDREKEPQLAYDSSAWKNSGIKICYLEKQFRQEDLTFINILNKIRSNQAGENELNVLKTRLLKPLGFSIKPTKLYTHNVNVDAINSYELSRVPGDEAVFEMTESGPKELTDLLKKSCLAPRELKLKAGAVVMFIKNNFDAGYVNGTLGKIAGFNEDGYPVVKTKKDSQITAIPASWTIEEDDEVIARVSQIPLRLAWAITVHKSQGMSLDAAEIDLSKSFERGMGYVALSRVRTLDGIRLMGINELALKVNERVVIKDKEFKSS